MTTTQTTAPETERGDQQLTYRPRHAPVPPKIDDADRPPEDEIEQQRRALRPRRKKKRPTK
jgi:hypothetical protein